MSRGWEPAAVRVVGVVVGVVAAAAGGAVLGSWWWTASALGALAAVGGWWARAAGLVHAAATLVLAVGAVVADTTWLVPLLVIGILGSLEAGALADRVTIARPHVGTADAARAARTVGLAAALSAGLVVLATVDVPGGAVATLVAAVASVVLVQALPGAR